MTHLEFETLMVTIFAGIILIGFIAKISKSMGVSIIVFIPCALTLTLLAGPIIGIIGGLVIAAAFVRPPDEQ